MATSTIAIERSGPVVIVRINRPPANAIDLDICQAMDAAFDEVMAGGPAAIVLTGTGRFFCAGLDLKIVPTYDRATQRTMLLAINRMVTKLYACPVPVVGAVNGHAIAGGMILALTPDYRVGPTGPALFGLTEARAGIPFPAAPMIVLRAELAPEHVRTVTLQARNFGPEEARAKGVLDELSPPDRVLARALEIARDLATIPPDAYRRIKQQVRADALTRLEALLATGNDPMLEGWLTPDAAAASASVLRGAAGRQT
jgi:enoyl-CoA hydratase